MIRSWLNSLQLQMSLTSMLLLSEFMNFTQNKKQIIPSQARWQWLATTLQQIQFFFKLEKLKKVFFTLRSTVNFAFLYIQPNCEIRSKSVVKSLPETSTISHPHTFECLQFKLKTTNPVLDNNDNLGSVDSFEVWRIQWRVYMYHEVSLA